MQVVKRVVNAVSAVILTLSTVMPLALVGIAHATPKTCTWVGTAGDQKFSTASNWSNCSAGVPLAGDTIRFATAAGSQGAATLTNDLGVALGGVVVAYSASALTGYYYGVDTISLASGATITSETQTACTDAQVGLHFTNITSTGNITDDIGVVGGIVHITGSLTIDYGQLSPDAGSSVGGNVIITAPVNTGKDGCSNGSAGSAPSGASITGFTINGMTVQNGGYVALGNTTFPLTLGGGSSSTPPSVQFYGGYDSNNNPAATTYTVSSAITLLGNAQFYVNDLTTANITGAISGSGFAITRDPTSSNTGVLNINPSSNSSSTQTGGLTNAPTTQTISDSQPTTGIAVVDKETATLDGTRGYVTVDGGGTLKGTGTAQTINVAKDGTVAPGHSPGTLTATNQLILNDGATFQAELKDAAAGDFDQIVVGQSTDTTGNDVTLGNTPTTGSTLDVQPYAGANIKAGDTFEIINNKSQTAVLNTFAGLPEGATFKVGNGTMKITYKGGDGNDVVLTALTAITAPNTGFAIISAHPAATLMSTTAAAALIFALARMASRKTTPARAKARR